MYIYIYIYIYIYRERERERYIYIYIHQWTPAEIRSIHGTDERVSIQALGRAARYFGSTLLAAALPSHELERLALPPRDR